VTRIKIPLDDPAFEISGDDTRVQSRGTKLLINILNDLIDLEGLKARYQQTRLA
jgi:hypothetical protein